MNPLTINQYHLFVRVHVSHLGELIDVSLLILSSETYVSGPTKVNLSVGLLSEGVYDIKSTDGRGL